VSNPRSLPAAAAFDWDGTLVDTLGMIYRANVAALAPYGITMSRAWFRERYTPDWRSSYRELGIPEERWDEMSARWAAEMALMRPRAIPWARGALRRLRAEGVRIGLVTASTRAVVEPTIARLNLADIFDAAWYADDVELSKPHPEALLRALDELGVAPADTVYVGDTTVDLEMAVAAGARFVAVGRTTPEAVFRAAGVERVWSGVGAWADHVLADAGRAPGRDGGRARSGHGSPGKRSERHRRQPAGSP
jgi:HAD superfamily hydrolase (TIGR01509 family)